MRSKPGQSTASLRQRNPIPLLLIDNLACAIVRYVNGQVVERFEITDRQHFDRSFTQSVAEHLRIGAMLS